MSTSNITVCNSELTETSVSTIFEGRKISFCEQECLDEFNLDQDKFLNSDHFLIDFDILPEVVPENK